MYTVKLGQCFAKTPFWFRNLFNSCECFQAVEQQLANFNGAYLLDAPPTVYFKSEQDYLLCVMRWS